MFESVEKRKLMSLLTLLVEFTMDYGEEFKVAKLDSNEEQYCIQLWIPNTVKEGTFGHAKLRSIIEHKDFIVVRLEENQGFRRLEIRRSNK